MSSTTTSFNTLPPATSPFDVFIYARIPALDEYLSAESQSILLELIFWSITYLIYAATFSELVRSIMSKMSFWNQAVKTKVGVFCWNGQDDVVLLVVLGLHHLLAGYMCMLGVQNHDANMWRHGYLLEVGFEVGDVAALIFSLYPHRHENIKPDAKAGLIFHHLPGILTGGMILKYGLHHNEHVRTIAFWMLVGAFASCVGAIAVHLQDLQTQMKQATLSLILNLSFFAYCRFYIFPKEAFLVLQDVDDDPNLRNDTWLIVGLQAFGVLMTCFNTLIMADGIPRSYRYIKRTMDGVTEVELVQVPLSREDRWKQEADIKKML